VILEALRLLTACAAQVSRINPGRARRVQLGDEEVLLAPALSLEGTRRFRELVGYRLARDERISCGIHGDALGHV
jgi:hypothetical protein